MPPNQWTEQRRQDRLADDQALQDLESDRDREDEALSIEEQLERSRNAPRNDPGAMCVVHQRYLSFPEWTGSGCKWCYHGSKEAYAAYLESRNLDRNGRPKRVAAVKEIA